MNIEDYISFDYFAYTARFYEKDSGKCILEIPSATKPIKVVFDNGVQIIDESEVDLYEDSEPASDKEIEELLGIQRGDKVSSL